MENAICNVYVRYGGMVNNISWDAVCGLKSDWNRIEIKWNQIETLLPNLNSFVLQAGEPCMPINAIIWLYLLLWSVLFFHLYFLLLSFVLFAPPFFGIVQLSHPILFFFFFSSAPPPLIEANLLQCTFYLLGYFDISIFPRFCISESVSQYFISAFYIFLVLFSFLVFSVYSLHPFVKNRHI